MKFKITITKEVIDKSAYCKKDNNISENCALAVAYNELIPNVRVGSRDVWFYDSKDNVLRDIHQTTPQIIFVNSFDSMTPEQRYSLVGREFEVEIPDSVIEYWHGDVVKAAQKIIDNPILKPLQLITV